MALINIKNSRLFKFIVLCTSLILAFMAAYYSVIGFSAMSGNDISIIIMASALELSKIVSVSILYRYWEDLSKSIKYYLSVGVFILMIFTSLGIYSHLTDTFQGEQNKITVQDIEIEKLQGKINQFEEQATSIDDLISNKQERINILQQQRSDQEDRVSKLYETENYYSARRATKLIEESDKQIVNLQKSINKHNDDKFALQDSVQVYKSTISDIQIESNVTSEVGSLKYLSQLLDVPLNEVFNYYILLIIVVFDPLALTLIITSNFISEYQLNPGETPVNSGIEEDDIILNDEFERIDSLDSINISEEPIEKQGDNFSETSILAQDDEQSVDAWNVYNENLAEHEKKVASEDKKPYVNINHKLENGDEVKTIERVENKNNNSYTNVVNP